MDELGNYPFNLCRCSTSIGKPLWQVLPAVHSSTALIRSNSRTAQTYRSMVNQANINVIKHLHLQVYLEGSEFYEGQQGIFIFPNWLPSWLMVVFCIWTAFWTTSELRKWNSAFKIFQGKAPLSRFNINTENAIITRKKLVENID